MGVVKERQGEGHVGGFVQRGKMLCSGRLCGRLLPAMELRDELSHL